VEDGEHIEVIDEAILAGKRMILGRGSPPEKAVISTPPPLGEP
jgi:hypothetical protein